MKIQILICSFFLAGLFATPSFAQCQSKAKAKQASWNNSPDIIGVATSTDDFSTLVAAVKAAGLVKTLQGNGPFTVFAPTNAAFAKLPEGTIATLLKPENKDQLTKILTYHVIAGEFMASDVVGAIKNSGGSFTVETVSGDKLTASIRNGGVILTDENGGVSRISKTDVKASNGVVHVIDSVVLPK